MSFGRELVVLLTKHGRFCKQNNQLPTKTHAELKDNSNINHVSRLKHTTQIPLGLGHASLHLFQTSNMQKLVWKFSFQEIVIHMANPTLHTQRLIYSLLSILFGGWCIKHGKETFSRNELL